MTNEELPKIVLESIRIEFPYYKQWPPETHNRIIGVTKHAEGSNEGLKRSFRTLLRVPTVVRLKRRSGSHAQALPGPSGS